jgi:hypothetical protein
MIREIEVFMSKEGEVLAEVPSGEMWHVLSFEPGPNIATWILRVHVSRRGHAGEAEPPPARSS